MRLRLLASILFAGCTIQSAPPQQYPQQQPYQVQQPPPQQTTYQAPPQQPQPPPPDQTYQQPPPQQTYTPPPPQPQQAVTYYDTPTYDTVSYNASGDTVPNIDI